MPFRRSIWEFDSQYAIPPNWGSGADLAMIAQLQSVEAAKKRTPPAPLARLADMAQRLRGSPDPYSVTPERFADFLRGLVGYGVGIKTAVSMLAVISEGAFPLMDKRVASGLVALGIVGEPEWSAGRAEGLSARDLDAHWAEAGSK